MTWINRKFARYTFLIAAAGMIGGCKPKEGGSGGEGGGAATSGGRQFISIGTAPVGGVFYTIGGAISDVLDQKGPENWKVSAESTGGSLENIRMLDSENIQFAICNSSISYFAGRGEGEDFEKAYKIRTVMTLFPNVAMFVAKKGSGVTKIQDLKGKRVTVGPQGAGFEYFIKPLLKAHGVTYADFTPLNAGQQTCVDYLGDGSAAAAFLGGGVPTASIVSAGATMDILLVPYGEKERDQLANDYAFFSPFTIKAKTYKGQEEPYNGLNVGSAHLVTHAGIDDEAVYQAAKTIFENKELIVEKHGAGRAINAKNVIRNTGTEFHPGAIRYYKEIGIWPGSEPKAEAAEPKDEGETADPEPAAAKPVEAKAAEVPAKK
jgi:uncharacterized protein